MYPGELTNFFWILGLVNIIWLVVLTVIVFKNNLFFKKLFPKEVGSIEDKLEKAIAAVGEIERFKKESLNFIQKVTLKRYNPYHDTGGDQSFSASWVDGKGNGIVVTSLHSRAGTRVFAKPVKGGLADKLQFSQEEMEVIKEANA